MSHTVALTQTLLLHLRLAGATAGVTLIGCLLALEFVPMRPKARHVLILFTMLVCAVFVISTLQVQQNIR